MYTLTPPKPNTCCNKHLIQKPKDTLSESEHWKMYCMTVL